MRHALGGRCSHGRIAPSIVSSSLVATFVSPEMWRVFHQRARLTVPFLV